MFDYRIMILSSIKLLVFAEWIELPQFSDDSKVYKSVHSYDHSFYDKFDSEISSQYDVDTNVSGIATAYPSNIFNESLDDDDGDDNDDDDDEDDPELLTSPEVTSTTEPPLTLDAPTEEYGTTASPEYILEESKRENCRNETIEGLKFQDYLPMEILSRVHKTLESQPSTLEGKIVFLKKFEKNLMAEIEERLGTALAPPRRIRGAHDYSDHDDEMGFPSLEGALMAISFLTFAVYLVRLVMLLFRNASTSTASTSAATIFFGRNRRSTETLNNKTDEVFKYLNNFTEHL